MHSSPVKIEARADNVSFDDESMHVSLADGRVIIVPLGPLSR